MGEPQGPPSQGEAPQDFPAVTPRDLYPTSDIRFVMLSIGELTTKVNSLISTVDRHGEKIDDLRHKVSFVKGAMWVIGALVGLISIALLWFFTGKLNVTISG